MTRNRISLIESQSQVIMRINIISFIRLVILIIIFFSVIFSIIYYLFSILCTTMNFSLLNPVFELIKESSHNSIRFYYAGNVINTDYWTFVIFSSVILISLIFLQTIVTLSLYNYLRIRYGGIILSCKEKFFF